LLLLAMLFPVAVYLAILGWLNRRARGFLISGPWDFCGILFAASGFLMLGGPALLDSFNQSEAWRRLWLMGKAGENTPLSERLEIGRAVLYASYFLLVVSATAYLLWRRRRLTAIYNVDPALLETVLGEVFQRLQLSFVQTGNVLLIEPERSVPPSRTETDGQPVLTAPPSIVVEKVTTLVIEASNRMCHVSLWWEPAGCLLRREVELQLRRALAARRAPYNSVGDWLLLASSVLFFLLLMGAGILVLYRLTR